VRCPIFLDTAFWCARFQEIVMKREQITIPLDPALREFVERAAAEQDRTMAGQVRHLIAEAARRSQEQERRAA
jgi:hypothetical protein